MTLTPLFEAPIAVQVHVALAIAALALSPALLAARKGTATHRALGRAWAGAMALLALGSFAIRGEGAWWGMSWIHILSVVVLVSLAYGIAAIRGGNVRAHRSNMLWLMSVGLFLTGLFTLLPGRLMHQVAFGG